MKKEQIIKLGSDDMVFWRDVIDSKTQDIKISEQNIKLFNLIIEGAKKEYEKAEKEFNDL